MELFYFQEEQQLDDFIISSKTLSAGAEFLQSWTWGEILKNEGKEIIRLGLRKENKILVAVTLVKESFLHNFYYWYAPRGPIFANNLQHREVVQNFLLTAIRKLDSQVLFLRLEPQKENLEFTKSQFKFQKTIDIQPAQTLILNLKIGEEEILKAMHQKTRYNLRLAQKKGVQVREGNKDDLAEFWRLLNLTSQRDNFRLHSLEHYQNLLSTGKGFIRLFLANYQGVNIAAGLFSFYGNKVTYLHGASDNQFRQLMAPYRLQWSVIQQALQEHYTYYDFYGIDEQKWPGVTRFKLGFGGERVKYAGTTDFIFRPRAYQFYSLLRKLRRQSFSSS